MRSLVGRRAGKAILGGGLGAAIALTVVVIFSTGVTWGAGASPSPVPPAPAPPAPPAPAAVPASAPRGIVLPSAGSIVVVRRSAGQDSLWSVDPVTKVAAQLVTLPFRPSSVEASPDGRRLAYLPSSVGPKVYVYDTKTGTLVSRSLAARGVKVVDSLTWLTKTKLLVAGKKTPGLAYYPFTDRLYTLSATTGASASYRGMPGTEPSASPTAARLVFVRFSKGGLVSSGSPLHWIIERLYRVKLAAGARPRLIGSAKYPGGLDIRRFNDPRLSPDGGWVISSTTGSDISVSYMVRSATTGKVRQRLNTTLAGRDATAWSNHGDRVAFWSMPPADDTTTMRLIVYTVASDTQKASPKVSSQAVTGFSWSSNDALLAYSARGLMSADDNAELWTIDPSSLALSSRVDLGKGSMPVFLP